MKIISVTAHPLRTELETPFAFSQGWVRARSATLVEVRTDDGLVGWGEAFCQGWRCRKSRQPSSVTALRR